MTEITAEQSEWSVIYPVYIDAKKTRTQGRRISITQCENPTINEILLVCKALNLEAVAEPNKAYPRDYMLKGRVRVKLKTSEGTRATGATSKHQLLLKLAEEIPRLSTRNKSQTQTKGKKNKNKKR